MTLISLLALAVTPMEVRIASGILCVIFVAIIIMRRKRMASKRRSMP